MPVVTTLLDPEQTTQEELANLYLARWNNRYALGNVAKQQQDAGDIAGLIRQRSLDAFDMSRDTVDPWQFFDIIEQLPGLDDLSIIRDELRCRLRRKEIVVRLSDDIVMLDAMQVQVMLIYISAVSGNVLADHT